MTFSKLLLIWVSAFLISSTSLCEMSATYVSVVHPPSREQGNYVPSLYTNFRDAYADDYSSIDDADTYADDSDLDFDSSPDAPFEPTKHTQLDISKRSSANPSDSSFPDVDSSNGDPSDLSCLFIMYDPLYGKKICKFKTLNVHEPPSLSDKQRFKEEEAIAVELRRRMGVDDHNIDAVQPVRLLTDNWKGQNNKRGKKRTDDSLAQIDDIDDDTNPDDYTDIQSRELEMQYQLEQRVNMLNNQLKQLKDAQTQLRGRQEQDRYLYNENIIGAYAASAERIQISKLILFIILVAILFTL